MDFSQNENQKKHGLMILVFLVGFVLGVLGATLYFQAKMADIGGKAGIMEKKPPAVPSIPQNVQPQPENDADVLPEIPEDIPTPLPLP